MGDPFSVAASTASFVSLGIQVCGGLISYCRAWKSHDKEIEEALTRLTDLELTLRTLSSILQMIESLDDSTAETLHGARQMIRSCTAALNKLNDALIETESISQPAGILDKLHNVRVRSMSLFNKEKLTGFQDSVAQTQRNLDSAIQILNLHLVGKQSIAIGNLAADNRDQAVQIPDTVERALIKQLDVFGHHFSMLKQDVRNTSSQHAQSIQQLTESITALQLGVIQKPSLIQSAYKEQRRLQSQQLNLRSRSLQHCTCRALTKYRPLLESKSYRYQGISAPRRWNAATFASTLVHRWDCPLFEEAEEVKQFGFRVSYSGSLLAGTIQAAMTMTRGYGGLSISPMLAYNPTVSTDAAVFRILDIDFNDEASAADMQATFAFRKQELSRLYIEGKASPRDLDEEGNTVLHQACRLFAESSFTMRVDSDTSEIWFQFLRSIHELGVPLNSTNTAGLTPLGVLVQLYPTYAILLSLKMLGIGAQLPLFTREAIHDYRQKSLALAFVFTQIPDLAEAMGCNEISQAILAKSQPRLEITVHRSPESINQPNVIGQTPLHFSGGWPEGMRLLLDTGAAVDATDDFGLTPVFYAAEFGLPEPVNILGEAGCALHTFPHHQSILPLGSEIETLLEYAIGLETRNRRYGYCPEGSNDEYEAVVDAIIRLVAQRRRVLEALVQTSLDSKSIGRLQLSPETVLDHKASLAMSMLHEKIDIRESLKGLSPVQSTVYHIRHLNLGQAHVLWNAGFHDIDELNSLGQSSLMSYDDLISHDSLYQRLEVAEWLVQKGAVLHRRQSHAFQYRMKKIHKTDRASSVTALHYLAASLGTVFIDGLRAKQENQCFLHKLHALTEKAKRITWTVLTDPLHDCCNCSCSIDGCSAYTMMVKYPVVRAPKYISYSTAYATKAAFRVTQAVDHWLNVDRPSLAWLRCNMLRFITFERLRLRHTCCKMDFMGDEERVIVELDDEEDRREIREEQAEQAEKLEALLVEFEEKYDEFGVPFSEFLNGYWKDRMKEISREKVPIDQTELESIGVTLRETCSNTSSHSSEDEESRFDEVDSDD